MSDYRFASDDHRLNCDPDASDGYGHDLDNADWVEVDNNMFIRERTCQMSNEDWDDSFGEYRHLYECGICSESTALFCCINENGDTEWVKPKFCGNCGAKAVKQ